MQLVISDSNGIEVASTDDFTLKYEYGDACNYELSVNADLQAHWRWHIDGTPFAGFLDTPCTDHGASGDTLVFKGRNIQGALQKKIIEPPTGQSSYVFSGDAHTMLSEVIQLLGLEDYLRAPSKPSGVHIDYRFYRYIDAWNGLRMALASSNARLRITCQQDGHLLEALPRTTYGQLDSEQVYFSLECNHLPVNHLIGLGKGEGTARAVSHWYADLLGNVSQTQSLFGVHENSLVHSASSDEATALSMKTKAKLEEYQQGSDARVSIPDDVMLDVGDIIAISSAKYNLKATTQVCGVVMKVEKGQHQINYEFGMPNYPDEEG